MKSKRNVYLDMKSIEEAKKILFDLFEDRVTKTETLDVVNSKGRVLVKPAKATVTNDHFFIVFSLYCLGISKYHNANKA